MDGPSESSYKTPASNSPLLPLLLLSLATQRHAPRTGTCLKKKYDFIVVGGGPAGSIVASRLSEDKCKTVLLLEAGHMPPLLTEVPAYAGYFLGTDVDWKYKTVPQKWAAYGKKERRIEFATGKMLGGSSNHNDMLAIRGNRKNYDDWETKGAKGWSYKDVFPYFLKIEDFKVPQFLLNGYHATGGKITVQLPDYQPEIKVAMASSILSLGSTLIDINAERQSGFWDTYANIRSGQRCSPVKGYLVPAENRTNLDIFTKAMVTKVIFEGNEAKGVEVYYKGKYKTIKAKKEVILSAGSVNTPQLLMLSGVGPADELTKFGIPVIADLPVGKNFHDHPIIHYLFTINTLSGPLPDKLANDIFIQEYISKRSGPVASLLGLLYGIFSRDGRVNSTIDFPTAYSFIGELPIKFSGNGNYKPNVYKQFIEPYKDDNIASCYVSSAQPKSRGTVTLNSTNPFDPPIIDPNYLEVESDLQDILDGVKLCNKIIQTPSFKLINAKPFETKVPGCEMYSSSEDDYLKCYISSLLSSNYHGVGSCKMGDANDPSTVVDPQLRVKNVKRLRVVDASVMPTITSGNINFPTMMIGEKASDMIKKDYPRKPKRSQ